LLSLCVDGGVGYDVYLEIGNHPKIALFDSFSLSQVILDEGVM